MKRTAGSAALALSGGGALGAAHVGVIAALEEQGIDFDYVAGVSAGALAGAMLACGHDADSIWKAVQRTKLFKLIAAFPSAGFGLIRGKKIHRLFCELFEDRSFSDLCIPFAVGATDFQNGERVLISEGKVADAVLASVSVPVLFEPFFHPLLQRWLVDGGITENLPLEPVIRGYQGRRIIAVDVATMLDSEIDFASAKQRGRYRNLMEAGLRSLRIILKNQQRHLPADARVQWIRPDLKEYRAIDVAKLSQIYEQGRKAVLARAGEPLVPDALAADS